jgi:hypothetical protein
MKRKQHIVKSFAIILLLVFSQKIGIGLYLHNWLHVSNYKQSSQSHGTNVAGYGCTCVDDFSMPFTENLEPVGQTIYPIEVEFVSSHKFLIPLSATLFYSLRGPPFFS